MRNIPFVAKRPIEVAPWEVFGSTREQYERWVGEICSIACLRSLILAKYGHSPSLWSLVEEACDVGVFIQGEHKILGAFHRPLCELMQRYDISGSVVGPISEPSIWNALDNSIAILSIDLSALRADLSGGHLILVFDKLESEGSYLIHDNAQIVCSSGEACKVSRKELNRISNGKGIFIQLDSLSSSTSTQS